MRGIEASFVNKWFLESSAYLMFGCMFICGRKNLITKEKENSSDFLVFGLD